MPKKPSYTLHKPSGRGRVRIGGKDIYLDGLHGSEESLTHYDDVVREWLIKQGNVSNVQLSVGDLTLLYLRHAESYYVKDGSPTREVKNIRSALRLLNQHCRNTRARLFGPRMLRQFRDSLVGKPDQRVKNGKERTLSRQYINKAARKIIRMFKWAASEEHVPVEVWQSLTTVEGLAKGRTIAHEGRKVKPVEDGDIDAVIPWLPPPVAAMVALQRGTGMRPGEVVQMRPCDVTRRTDGVWAYRPPTFKTEHHDDDAERIIFIGPKGQVVLAPWLERDPEAPCFSPRESMAWLQSQKRTKRKTRVQPSQQDRSKAQPKRQPGEQYTEESYRRSIHYACKKSGVAKWSPNQIRHAVGTVVRKEYGLEAAQVVLGHSRADVTQTYAERDQQKAADVIAKIG